MKYTLLYYIQFDGELKLHLRSQSFCHAWKGEPDDYVSHPVDKGGHSDGGRAWVLKEELWRNHPGNGARSKGEEKHEQKGWRHKEDADARRIGVQVEGNGEENAEKEQQ